MRFAWPRGSLTTTIAVDAIAGTVALTSTVLVRHVSEPSRNLAVAASPMAVVTGTATKPRLKQAIEARQEAHAASIEQRAVMPLPLTDFADSPSDYDVGPGSGRQTNEEIAAFTNDRTDTAQTWSALGRLEGYNLVVWGRTTRARRGIGTWIGLYRDEPSAQASYEPTLGTAMLQRSILVLIRNDGHPR